MSTAVAVVLVLAALAYAVFAGADFGAGFWDLAAGGLIAAESGLHLSGFDGGPNERMVMAAHPAIAEEYFALVRACGF